MMVKKNVGGLEEMVKTKQSKYVQKCGIKFQKIINQTILVNIVQ